MVTLLLEKIGAIQLDSSIAIAMAIIEIFYCTILILRTIFSAVFTNLKKETKTKKVIAKIIEIFNVILGALKILKEKGAEYGKENERTADSDSNGTSTSDCEGARTDENDRRIKK